MHIQCVLVNAIGSYFAQHYKQKGYEPVGCTELSVLGILDPPGSGSTEGLAERACRHFYDRRRRNPRIVTVDKFKVSTSIAIAALTGVVPHNGNDLFKLGRKADRADANPYLEGLEAEERGLEILLCRWLCENKDPTLAYYTALGHWSQRPFRDQHNSQLLQAVKKFEEDRLARASKTFANNLGMKHVTLVKAPQDLSGFDVWHRKFSPCIVVFREGDKTHDAFIEVSVKDRASAANLFGPDGLKEVFSNLKPGVWTGDMTKARSPLGQPVTYVDAETAARALEQHAGKRAAGIVVVT